VSPGTGRRLASGQAGIGLRAPHLGEVQAARPPVAWLEVHAENYLGGGPARRALLAIRREYPVSLHAVGLSLGTAEGMDGRHLERVADLVGALEPALVSEHLSWSVTGGAYLNDLLPLPYTEEALGVVSRAVDRVQARLGRSILVENPSRYLRFRHSPIPEPEFLAELCRRTGCGLLLDVNNVYVSAANLGLDAAAYLQAVPAERVEEIHLAGHARNDADGVTVLIDDHGSPVAPPVWALFEAALARLGPRPTLIEWDTDLPPLATLLAEAGRAAARLAAAPRATEAPAGRAG
jgi:uncharacterized protein (UPF0276 family)